MGLFGRLFGSKSGPRQPSPTADPGSLIVASAAREVEGVRAEYEEFVDGFCFRPRKNLMRYLAANGLGRVRDWLHWSTEEPEARAFVRFGVEAMRQGLKVWDLPGLSFYLKGRGPSQESQDCLSLLAQVLRKPITLYFEDPSGGPVQALDFRP